MKLLKQSLCLTGLLGCVLTTPAFAEYEPETGMYKACISYKNSNYLDFPSCKN